MLRQRTTTGLAAPMVPVPWVLSSEANWTGAGRPGGANALPGRGKRALAREGLPGRACKRAQPGPASATTATGGARRRRAAGYSLRCRRVR